MALSAGGWCDFGADRSAATGPVDDDGARPLMLVWIALTFIPEPSPWLPNLVLGPA
jgi:hypothetical protein